MGYQDKLDPSGKTKPGYRECGIRYDLIKEYCSGLPELCSVCDIGSSWNYFGISLTRDFPNCRVMAFEYNSYRLRIEHLKKNRADRVFLVNKKLTVSDIRLLGEIKQFDLVLALSVLHHIKGSETEKVEVLRSLGRNVIVEFALSDSPRIAKNQALEIAEIIKTGRVLGYGESHKVKGFKRPIVLFENE